MIKAQTCNLGVVGCSSSYNKKLTERAQIFIDLSWVKNWLADIRMLNKNKVGQPYSYPEALIKMLAMLKAKGFSFRELSGIVEGLESRLGPFPIITFSQIRRRILDLDLNLSGNAKGKVIAIDGTGLKVTNRGEWIRHKWKIKRGWIKVVISGTTDGNLVDLEIGDETFDEKASARNMIKRNKPKEVLLDGLHDTYETYDVCEENGATLWTPSRKGSMSRGFHQRNRAVKRQLEMGRKKWVEKTGFGMRWPASEGIFSAVKTIFGENLTCHKGECLMKEAKLKFWAYQNLRNKMPM